MTALLGAADQAWADALRQQHFPPARNHLAAHLTLFHHLPPSLEGEVRRMLSRACAGPRPEARIGGVYSLGRGVAIEIRSADLLAIREEMAERLRHHLIPQDRATPRLHITVQNKVEAAVARATLASLEPIVPPRPVIIAGLALWHYRGGPWTPIARCAFRG